MTKSDGKAQTTYRQAALHTAAVAMEEARQGKDLRIVQIGLLYALVLVLADIGERLAEIKEDLPLVGR